jgi:FkbM family methyltransferase
MKPLFYHFALSRSFFAHFFKATFKQHHRELKPVFERFIAKDGIVIDVGGHAGQFSKLFAGIAAQGCVFTFEPATYARVILRAALSLNRKHNVVIVPAGLATHSGCELLNIPVKRRRSLGFGLSHIGSDNSEHTTVQEPIVLITLDEFIEKTGIERVDFIKADIEGWELRMLEGAGETLKRFRPTIMIELDEHHLNRAGDTLEKAWTHLTHLGYTPHILDDEGVLQKVPHLRAGDIWWIIC